MCRADDQRENQQEDPAVTHDEAGKLRYVRDQGLMQRLGDRLVEDQDQRRQGGDAPQHAEHNALSHDQTQVKAEREGHEAQGDKACHGGDGRAHDRRDGIGNRLGHRLLAACAHHGLLGFLVAVPQEDGIVHRHAQLKHGGERLGDVGDLPEEEVGAHVEQDRHADGRHEQHRQQDRIHEDGQHHARQQHGDADVDRLFLFAQLLHIRHHC